VPAAADIGKLDNLLNDPRTESVSMSEANLEGAGA